MDKSMELIERYLQEVGRRLPAAKRADILSELRSSLVDDLEGRVGEYFSEQDVVQLLQEWGPPSKVAASFDPGAQYLIGPDLYPLFRMVIGIVFMAVIGAQLLAVVIGAAVAGAQPNWLESFWSIINSLPVSLGFVVIVFAVLQRFEVKPDTDEEPFDPLKLPQLAEEEPVNRIETAVSIIVSVIVLVLLASLATGGGIAVSFETIIFTNPVIDRLFVWLVLSMLAGIIVDIVILWRRRWDSSTRFLKIGSNIFSLAVLYLLIQGHNAWLVEAGAGGMFESLALLSDNIVVGAQLFGMAAFRLAFTVAFIVISIETLKQVYRLGKGLFSTQTAGSLQQTLGSGD